MSLRLQHHGGWTLVELMVAILIISILAGLSLSVGSAILSSSDIRRTEDLLTLLDAATQEFSLLEGREPTYGINGQPEPDQGAFRGSRYEVNLGAILAGGNGCDGCGGGLQQVLDFNTSELPSESQLVCSQWCQVDGCSGGGDAVYEGVGASFLLMLNERPASRVILAAIEPDLLLRIKAQLSTSGGTELFDSVMPIDAWGNPVLVVLPGHGRDGADTFDYPRKDADGTVRTKEEQSLGPALREHAYFVSAGPDGKFGNIEYDQSLRDSFNAESDQEEFLQAQDNVYSYGVVSW